ncbi:MAG: rod shape-determining protein MreC [Planktomarina sp.]|nr:rod shape-determining protein MreC [Planktomarina sp.]
MVRERSKNTDFYSAVAYRIILGILITLLLGVFLFWRIDSPRVEQIRMNIIDKVIPNFSWAGIPLTKAFNLLLAAKSYEEIFEQNQNLRRELQQMKAWKEAALQREQENAKLLDLNKVRLDPKFTKITGVVLADSGGPFRQTVLLNIGKRDGILDGWAAMDGLGLVGRISGVAQKTSRVILLGDTSSRIPIKIDSGGQRALLIGDNTRYPSIEFLEYPETVRPGDRVMTSGDGDVFPPGILVGQVIKSQTGKLRVMLSADTQRLDFLRVIRHLPREKVNTAGGLVGQPSTQLSPSQND